MNKEETRNYQRDYMRLRRAAKKAGYDVAHYSRDELFDLAEKGLIQPSARKAAKRLTLDIPEETSTVAPVKITRPGYKPTVKPRPSKQVTSEVSELQRAMQWFIEESKKEGHTIEDLPKEVRAVIRTVLQGKPVSSSIQEKLQPIRDLYYQHHANQVPYATYSPSPDSIPRPAYPLANNTWHTRIDQVDDFNRHGKTI